MPTVELLTRRLTTLAPLTLNREAGTVEAILSTGAPVVRQGYTERLAVTADAVELAPHIPVLDAHRSGSIADVLGRVADVRFEAGRIVATLRISSPTALDAIARGDITGVSVGYAVAAWADARNPVSGTRTRTATRWRLVECSLVPLPADAGATLRSDPMPSETTTTEPATMTRAAVNQAIRQLGTRNGLPAAWSDALIDSDADIPTARNAALDALMERGANTPTIRTQAAVPGFTADPGHLAHRADAIAHRMAPGACPLTDASRPYAHHRVTDHARELLQLRGEPTAGLSPDQLLTRALHTGADFPGLLTGAGNRTLAAPYEAALSPIRVLFRDTTAPDFRARSRLTLSELPALLKVNEAGEIKYGTRAETAESYRLETYARIFSISRQALINDDLGAFGDFNRDAAAAAAETENALRASFLTQGAGNGPELSDGKRLFHADRGNVGAPAALSVASLSAGRLALRSQKSLDGKTPIGVTPAYLIVGPALETLAEQLLSTLAAPTPADVNPFSSGRLQLLVEPRLAGVGWYLFANPAQRPVFEQAHLTSAPGPQIASREGWDVLGVEFRVFLDYGAGALDWRGAYRNPGVA